MEDQFAWKEWGSELGWHVSTIYTSATGISNTREIGSPD
jgi:hypothetical protein